VFSRESVELSAWRFYFLGRLTMKGVRISEAHIGAFRLTVASPLAAFTRTVCAREVRITLGLRQRVSARRLGAELV
jgi:hypothetical protein